MSIKLDAVHLHYSLKSFRETSLKSYLFKLAKGKKEATQDVHAIKGVSFSVQSGERVGIIGHNGAGKSTLLRTIAGLYPISGGQCTVQGEIRSLFEITLGFEPEATGRENILYRGLLLGQSPKTMRTLEKEIVEFAEIGNFIDYPVKTYSSGMVVRLAFAISTIITGDILLIDEVIGAGDAAFMHKASERIRSLISKAKILLLVSHDLSAIRSFCHRLLVMDKGKLVYDGPIEEGISHYQKLAANK